MFNIFKGNTALENVQLKTDKFSKWSKTDKCNQSPCPMLNTLANYKLLPKENISSLNIKKALIDSECNILISSLLTVVFKLNFNKTKNLRKIGKHGVIEHDISLTREDYHLGDSITFNKKRFNKMKKFSSDGKNFTHNNMVKYFTYIKNQSEINNKQLKFNIMEFQKCLLEQSILFCLLNENNNSIPLKYLDYFLTKEKFPFKYGFKLTNRLNTFNLLKNYTKLLYRYFINSIY